MRRPFALPLLVLMLASPALAQSPPVPPSFQDLHTDLANTLEAFAGSLPPATDRSPVAFSAELAEADANRLAQLLAPTSLMGALLAIDRMADMGVEAVTVNISYPMLYKPFHGDLAEYRSYLGFYRTVATAARQRGLKLIVKTGALLAMDPRVRAFYGAVTTLDRYKAGRLEVATTIVHEIAPDYLTLQAEPDVEASQTGQPVGTALGAHDLVRFLVTGLAAPGTPHTSLGAGAGTWYSEFYDLAQDLGSVAGLDYLDVHVYPINRDFLWRALWAAELAHRAGKDIAVSEAWLYKVRDGELPMSGALFTELVSRDVFSFWEPLDSKFVEVMMRLAITKTFAFMSFFWTKYFFRYLDYQSTFFFPPDQLLTLSQVAATQAMLAGDLTRTGRTYGGLIRLHSLFESSP